MSELSQNPAVRLVSLGGCVIYQTAQNLNGAVIQHDGHMWRRPTIATMSKPVTRFNYDFSKLPAVFANYFVNDAAGNHLREVLRHSDASILLTDFTRDLLTGLIELEPGCWAMNPLDAIDLIDDLNHDNMSWEIMANVIRRDLKVLSPLRQWDAFFPIWQEATTRFLDTMTSTFKHVIVAEIYQTHQRLDRTAFFHDQNIDASNERLEQMYAWLRQRKDITFVTVDRQDLFTGKTGGPYGGPVATHYIEETYALWEAELTKAVNRLTNQHHDRNERMKEVAFKRAAAHEEALEKILELEGNISDLQSQIDALIIANDNATDTNQKMLAKIDAIEAAAAAAIAEANQQRDANAQRLLATIVSNEQALEVAKSENRVAHHQLEKLRLTLEEYRRPAWRRYKTQIARATRRIRKA